MVASPVRAHIHKVYSLHHFETQYQRIFGARCILIGMLNAEFFPLFILFSLGPFAHPFSYHRPRTYTFRSHFHILTVSLTPKSSDGCPFRWPYLILVHIYSIGIYPNGNFETLREFECMRSHPRYQLCSSLTSSIFSPSGNT